MVLLYNLYRICRQVDLVMHAYNADMWETEAERSGFEDQPGLQSNK